MLNELHVTAFGNLGRWARKDARIATHRRDKLKVYNALMITADGLPALGIVAAILGIVKAMGALDQSPALLGSLIGSALEAKRLELMADMPAPEGEQLMRAFSSVRHCAGRTNAALEKWRRDHQLY
mgnify:CR=1 FL=1